jgi:hypothetical protein
LHSPLLAAELTIRRATVADRRSLLYLHELGFGGHRSVDQWRWRFVDNPLRRTQVVGAFANDGSCVASFSGVPLPCLLDGRRTVVQRAGDASVHPDLRRGMAGASILRRTSQAFFAEFGDGSMCAAFGLPVPGLLRTLVRFCRFEVTADVLVLVRDLAKPDPGTSLATSTGDAIPPDADALTERWHRDVPSGILRDGRYLDWRYRSNPEQRYAIVTARGPDGTLRGLAVLRMAPVEGHALAIAEWIVPDDDGDAQRALLHAAVQCARRHGHASLALAAPTWSETFRRCQGDHRFQVRPTQHRIGFRPWSSRANQPFLAQNWHFSLCDIDWM